MKLSLETTAETKAIEAELARVKKYNDGKPAELMLAPGQSVVGGSVDKSLVRGDGASAGILALDKGVREEILSALMNDEYSGEGWSLVHDPINREKFAIAFNAKLDAIMDALDA
jgi:hypothetical protein